MKVDVNVVFAFINSKENKLYIDSAKNFTSTKKNLINNLNNGTHKNKRLSDAWKRNKEDFVIEILEYVDEGVSLQERKHYWINKYQSNEVQYGYNVEILPRPWELKRVTWSKSKSWGVNENIRSRINKYLKKLNYDLVYAEDRMKLIKEILNDEEIKWLSEYISSPLFAKKQIKTKQDFLAENDMSLMGLNLIVDYLTFPKFARKGEEQKHEVKVRNSKPNMQYNSDKEVLSNNLLLFEKYITTDKCNKINLNKSKKQKLYPVNFEQTVSVDDINNHKYLKELNDVLNNLSDILGYKLTGIKKDKHIKALEKRYSKKQINVMKKLYGELKKQSVIMKDMLCGTIYFKRITKGSTVFNFDNDTGYFDDKGDYHLVSENTIDFKDEKHILQLLNFYQELKTGFCDKIDSEMYWILNQLEELIDVTEFEDHIKDILMMKIEKYTNEEIEDELFIKYNISMPSSTINDTYNSTIPKMIITTYIQSREDYIYTYKKRGKYKTCSKCKQVKLASNRHFRVDNSKLDGFKHACKKCMK